MHVVVLEASILRAGFIRLSRSYRTVAWTEIPSADTPPTPSMSSESWRHGLCNGRFDFRYQRVKSSLSSGGIPAFARKIDAVLALLAHLFFFIIRSRLLRIRDSCVEPIMILVAASKKLIKFDTKTFLSTINGGRKIADFPRKKRMLAHGDSSDAVFYIHNGKVRFTVVANILYTPIQSPAA